MVNVIEATNLAMIASEPDDAPTPHLGTSADETMRSASWDEIDIARAGLQQLVVKSEVAASFADDERLVVRWMRACANSFDH